MRPCKHGRDGLPHDPACRVCVLDLTDAAYRASWGSRHVPPVAPYVPCRFEGTVVEFAPCDCEFKHVRVCLYDGPNYQGDRCTRGPNSGHDAGIASCVLCEYNSNA